jgi:hypothetical protein
LRIESGNDSLQLIFDPALAASLLRLLLETALGLGIDIRLDRHNLSPSG